MSVPMDRLLRLLPVACLLAGCAAPAAPPAAPGPAPVSVALTLVPQRALQAVSFSGTKAHRWTAADVHHYRVVLEVLAGEAYVATGKTMDVAVVAGVVKRPIVFSNLAGGKAYRVDVQAFKGEGDAAVRMNAKQPTLVAFDFRPGDAADLVTAKTEAATVVFDPVVLAGTLKVKVLGRPAGMAGLRAELWRQGGAAALKAADLPGDTGIVTFSNLGAGVPYVVKLAAKDGAGATLRAGESEAVTFDGAQQDVAQDAAVNVTLTAPAG